MSARKRKKKASKPKASKPKPAAAKKKRGAAATKARRKPPRRALKQVPKQASRKARRKSPRKAAKRPGLGLVPGAAKRPATPPSRSFPQTEGASGKQMVVFRLLKARARVLAALQGLAAGAADQPIGEGKWSTREIVLHLCCRDRARLREFEAALRGVPVSWQDLDDEEMGRVNAADVQPISRLAWDEALRLLHSTRQSLMDAIDGVPEDPAEVWSPDHPFGWMLHALPPHDQHHAEIIKQWRAEAGA
jgi:hypothetical protein